MTCGKEDPPGYSCGGGYPKGTHGCGQHFGSLNGFDAHFIRTGRYEDDESPIMRCATPKEMERKGYHLSDNLVWKTPIDEAAIARFRGHPSVTQGDLLAALGMTERG